MEILRRGQAARCDTGGDPRPMEIGLIVVAVAFSLPLLLLFLWW